MTLDRISRRTTGFLAMCAGLCVLAVTAQEPYEGGRGLITLEGPSGLFINPTSGTLPEGYGTLQYCFFLPNNETYPIGHGFYTAYGVSDKMEIGAAGNYINAPGDNLKGAGPNARYRVLDRTDALPEVSVGAYSRFGDDALDKIGAYAAAYQRFALAEGSPLRSVGVHAGVRNIWVDEDLNPDDTSLTGFAGLELELPARLYLVGEVSTKDDDFASKQPYAYGIQWRAVGVNISTGYIQTGDLEEASFYFGIGSAVAF